MPNEYSLTYSEEDAEKFLEVWKETFRLVRKEII